MVQVMSGDFGMHWYPPYDNHTDKRKLMKLAIKKCMENQLETTQQFEYGGKILGLFMVKGEVAIEEYYYNLLLEIVNSGEPKEVVLLLDKLLKYAKDEVFK